MFLSAIDVFVRTWVSGEILKNDFDPDPGGLVMWFMVSGTPRSST